MGSNHKTVKLVDHRKTPEIVTGEMVKKFLADALPKLKQQGYELKDDCVTIAIPIEKIPDDVEFPVHMLPSFKHHHLQNVPSIVEIFAEWMAGKFKG